jgi:hypothetical protein
VLQSSLCGLHTKGGGRNVVRYYMLLERKFENR